MRDAALGLQLPIMGIESEAQLLWVVVKFLTMPLPVGWRAVRIADAAGGALSSSIGGGGGGDGGEGVVYVNAQLGEHRSSHPLLPPFREMLRTLARDTSNIKALEHADKVDALGWMLFVDTEDAVPYFYNFRTGQLQWGFPDLAELRETSPSARHASIALRGRLLPHRPRLSRRALAHRADARHRRRDPAL